MSFRCVVSVLSARVSACGLRLCMPGRTLLATATNKRASRAMEWSEKEGERGDRNIELQNYFTDIRLLYESWKYVEKCTAISICRSMIQLLALFSSFVFPSLKRGWQSELMRACLTQLYTYDGRDNYTLAHASIKPTLIEFQLTILINLPITRFIELFGRKRRGRRVRNANNTFYENKLPWVIRRRIRRFCARAEEREREREPWPMELEAFVFASP